MKIGIHYSSGSFTKRWISYCEKNNIPYKMVNAYHNDIIDQLSDCDCFMWYVDQCNYKDMLFARQLLYSLQSCGIRVFPDMNTIWHFDDKLGQKYLLESIGAPLVPTHVFYTRRDARRWIKKTTFPKVFKLRGGAGASNVWLIHRKKDAFKLVRKAFGKGFPVYNRWGSLKERFRKYRKGRTNVLDVVKGILRLFVAPYSSRILGKERGYVYFQDFIPHNKFDIRIIVIGERAFGIKRMNRDKDFRASGSGNIIYDKLQLDEKCVKIAFDVSRKLKTQSLAFDFVFDKYKNPLIIELSYAFIAQGYDWCEGYWDSAMEWHNGGFDPQGWMVEDLIKNVNR